ncbi:hypothetical protein GEV33_014298 [Tenebrio molitor]|uniref:Uncharacterized protein n=1 Tax=Tenebrio molitor TaxID=7067 RepID=A0A8J6L794_TENMO|nr:hypothetical protein GEV33_014298 [Tenebrio molitor]
MFTQLGQKEIVFWRQCTPARPAAAQAPVRTLAKGQSHPAGARGVNMESLRSLSVRPLSAAGAQQAVIFGRDAVQFDVCRRGEGQRGVEGRGERDGRRLRGRRPLKVKREEELCTRIRMLRESESESALLLLRAAVLQRIGRDYTERSKLWLQDQRLIDWGGIRGGPPSAQRPLSKKSPFPPLTAGRRGVPSDVTALIFSTNTTTTTPA